MKVFDDEEGGGLRAEDVLERVVRRMGADCVELEPLAEGCWLVYDVGGVVRTGGG